MYVQNKRFSFQEWSIKLVNNQSTFFKDCLLVGFFPFFFFENQYYSSLNFHPIRHFHQLFNLIIFHCMDNHKFLNPYLIIYVSVSGREQVTDIEDCWEPKLREIEWMCRVSIYAFSNGSTYLKWLLLLPFIVNFFFFF